MNENWLKQWEDRYSKEEYAYGVLPNEYLKERLQQLPSGTLLLPAEGEGRNAVFAAKLGWKVMAFDISKEGKKKAMQLAANNNVTIDYQVGELHTLDLGSTQFDAIALIYAHFPADIRSSYHKVLNKYLRKGGVVIIEAFSKKHIEYFKRNEKVGGPRDIDSLFSIEEIRSDFTNYEVIELTETKIELSEGLYHNGTGCVIRFVGRKQ